FLFFATAMAAITGTSLLFPAPYWEWLWNLNRPAYVQFQAFHRAAGVLLYALGIGTFAAAVGLLRGRKWAWWIAVLVFAADCCGNVVSLFVIGDWLKTGVGLIVSGVFLFCLTSAGVRNYVRAPVNTM